ncbi:GEVED domain-containing protein [Tahibacter soli]|uniref:GEVED domain-containing protein n=1 Tax=Tahibacter soli TaxID=2983605 RepID=A0A9X3YKN6_9GAMM|nr:GEVED domain-containing protein [Tahibacter soli]MDC8014151.1 GEVED domain-containing protein [Tahibacter soli]
MISASLRLLFVLVLGLAATSVPAQSLTKTAIQVDPGNTKQTGQTFGYRLTYNCSSTSGPCIGAQVVDLLPAEVQYVSTVPASPTTSVAAINVTPNFGGSGRTRVQFVMVNPLPAGNSGDLLINVRFPNGTTPNGTVATNTADAINLGATPGTFTTPPVAVTAVAALQATLDKTLTSSPANLDLPETYRLRIAVSNNAGSLGLTAIGPVVDTLPPGTVFNGSTPAADCQPGCVGTTPATVTWTSPCSVPLNPNGTCDITVNVTFPSGTFPSGTNVTNSFTATVTPLGQPPQAVGPGTVTHPVTTFVPAPGASLAKNVAGGSPNPPTLNQTFSYDLVPGNNGNVALDNLVVVDTLPVAFQLASVTTGAYNGLADFAAGEGVRVSYEKNTAPGVFTLWGSSPNTTTSTTLTAPPPGLGAGEYVTRIRWAFGQAQPGMAPSTRPLVTGRIVNPDNAGGPVAFGATIANCVDLTAVYTAGPTNVTRNACRNFTLSGPFAQLNPAKDVLSGAGPFNPNQTVSFRLRVRSAPQSSDPVPLEYVVATDLLPVDLTFASWTFDDQGTGLPAPQVFNQIPNFAGTGRTLLRWRWNAGSGSLGVNQQTFINISTTVRNGAPSGNLSNDFTLEHDAPGLGQRCSGSSQADPLDYDGDGDTAETLCRATGTIAVAPIAQLDSDKLTQSVCDASFSSNGQTLPGGQIRYRVAVRNIGTVPMQNVVLVDLLPRVGDTGVRDTNPRGSQWQPQLVAPIVPPSGTTLYYSTAPNPCRGEVGGPTTGCDAPNWTTAAPEPISAATAFKLEFGSRVISAFDSLAFEFGMAAPANLPAGAAYNSFAYQAERGDGLGALAAEPQKAGVTLGSCPLAPALGDYVWVDSNDNGVQDDGNTGVNGVTATLYDSGGDGVSGTPDDVPVAQTVTQNSPGGQPGWYRFSSLTAGAWRVCIVPPPNFVPARADQGGNDTLDSDGNPVTHCSAPVTLGPGQDIPDVDFGLVPTAALGNYVWFDRNNDGLQNEPADDGANGVTVRLYADDGDGTPEPGAGDALVATTVTAPDAFGRAGYYGFDELVPGQPYFVQFVRPAAATAFTTRGAGADGGADSDASPADGTTAIVTLAPGEYAPDIDAGLIAPSGTLALGDQVWLDTDNDGIFEPPSGETGIDGVVLHLYRDVNGNGLADTDEYAGATASGVASGFSGRYRFGNLAPGSYIVAVAPSNFVGGAPLSGLSTSTGNDPAPDPDDDVNGDDNGTQSGAAVVSRAVTLTDNGEPTSEDGNNDTNLTVDFGFFGAQPPRFDYGDAPDAGAGSGPGNYATTVFDNGAVHALSAGSPYLGNCVDADDGTAQDALAAGDDSRGGATFGTCATPGDDEDGVTFASPFTVGTTATFTVRAGNVAACTLNAWVDWNGNGTFDAAEQIATDTPIAAGGTANVSATVPANAVPGGTYARFRCASAGGLAPTGIAADGEVEDYRVEIGGDDFGDAPASYGTQGAGAAQHVVTGPDPLRLGQCVDLEGDGAPSAGANGDDLAAGARYGLCFGDEDGVVFTAPVVACQSASVDVTANRAGRLDAWIDYNRDGDFADAGEQVFTSQNVVAGSQPLTFDVPCTSQAGNLYSRFRLSSAGGLGPAGSAPDGEVEDYVTLGGTSDFGDAPAPYPTLLANDGPRHAAIAGFSLGATIDGEADGQPTTPADGDGADEDGVTFPGGRLDVCTTASLSVSLTNTASVANARLDAWIDFNHDGDWSDAGERVATSLALASGANAVPVVVPCTALPGATYARFRLSSAGVAGVTGAAPDGEVEDYRVVLRGTDYGDAPDPTYQTLAASGGAMHRIDPTTSLYLGACVDSEADGQPSAGATGDDASTGAPGAGTCAGNDDEDGVVFTTPIAACRNGGMTVTAGAAGLFDAWIDFDRDGAFETAERIFDHQSLNAGANALTFAVPCTAQPGVSYLRMRLSSAGTNGPGGVAEDGEVEDHAVNIAAVDYGDAPDTYGTTRASNGPTHVIGASPLYLGACVDGEAEGAASTDALGDDGAAGSGTAGTCGVAGDEDGVVFATVPTACKAAPVTVTASAASRLDAWVDFNNDGDFGDAGEQVFANTALNAGANALTINVPCDSAGGNLFSRFRVSSTGGLGPNGPADDGEVEDHRILGTQQADFGDAPDTYGTTFASGGPRHAVGTGSTLFLGACVDTESDAATPLDATGDDTTTGGTVAGTCTGNDDEDGVTFATPLVACSAGSVSVTASEAGRLDAWIDFNRSGTFDDPAERIATSTPLAAGVNTVPVNVPCGANPGSTYGRFRISANGGLGVGGPATTGEVEDHALVLRATDWGDAPATYGTTQAGDGARHGITAGFSLGATVDAEPDGQPTVAADGDGADEDGLTFSDGTTFAACTTHALVVNLTNAAGVQTPRLDAWIDFDGDGQFNDPRDRIANGTALAAGANPLAVSVPCDVASHARTYARLRLSAAGTATPTGAALDGEVEDYAVATAGYDYGDAPAPYPTTRTQDGARHRVLDTANPTLGAAVDTEADGQPSAAANGDDLAGTPDDEDGVVFPSTLVPGTNGTVTIAAGATGGLVDGWIDFNADGDFDDAGEQILASHALAAAQSENVTFAVPVGATTGSTFARFRISAAGALAPTGAAPDGEIEDHLVGVGAAQPSIGVAKALAEVQRITPLRYRVAFDVRIANTGNVPLTNVSATDDLATVFTEALAFSVVSLTSADFAVNPAYDGRTNLQLLAPGATLAVGGAGVVRLAVEVELHRFFGPFRNTAVATGDTPGGGTVTDTSQDGANPDPDNNGDPGDNSDPTPVSFNVINPVAVPGPGLPALLLLAALLAGVALRRRTIV